MSSEKNLLEQLANSLLANQEVLGVLLQERFVRVGERFIPLRYVRGVRVARKPDEPCTVFVKMIDGEIEEFTGEEGSEQLLEFLYASSVDVMALEEESPTKGGDA